MKTKRRPTTDGILLRRTARFPEATLDEVAGCLRSKRKSKTSAQLRAAIGHEVIRVRIPADN